MNRENFIYPDNIYKGTDFWMLNDELSEEIIKQLSEMHDKGVYSFIARTYIGLKSDYPGSDFKAKLHIIVNTAKQLGMKVFLQAGYMPEAVVGLPEKYALRYIMPIRSGEENGRRIFASTKAQDIEWSFVEHNSKTFLDMFDPEAVDYYLRKSYEEMWEEFSEEYGKTIQSIWVDEPSYNGYYLPFTPRLETLYFERFASELAVDIPQLFIDSNSSATVRYRYRVLLRDLLESSYFERVRNWCSEHNLLFSGHLMMEETCASQITRAAACMPYYKYFDIPGIDVLGGAMNWNDDPIHPLDPIDIGMDQKLYTTAMQCVSAARQAGQKHILAEMYGVTSESMSFRDMLHMFDSYAAMGISHRSVHGMFYSLRGRGKRAYPPHISYYQPYFKKYKNVTEYCARVSEFISEGNTEADLAILHPLETAYTLYRGELGESPAGMDEKIDRSFAKLLRTLKTLHREVELCDLATLRNLGRVENGRLIVGKMSYSTLILPHIKVITSELFELLEQLSLEGGRIIILGELPNMLDGVPDSSLSEELSSLGTRVDSLTELVELIRSDERTYIINGSNSQNLLVNRRVTSDGMNFFIHNNDCSQSANAVLSVRGVYRVSSCNAFDGSVTEYPAETDEKTTFIKLKLECGSSILLTLDEGRPMGTTHSSAKPSIRMDNEWRIIPSGEGITAKNVLLFDSFSFSTDRENYSKPLPTTAIQKLLTDREYNGELSLKREFFSDSEVGEVFLALESPNEQQIFLDDIEADKTVLGYFCDESFEYIRLGELSAGKHTLEIRRSFTPLSKSKNAINSLFETQRGVELEPMYLLGDFKVAATPRISRNGCAVYEPDFRITEKINGYELTRGELTADGFPFFMGEMICKRGFVSPRSGSCKLRIKTLNAAVGEVFLNGVHVGDINRAPAELSCKQLHEGKNTLEIKLYPTLRNIIGPFHRTRGDIGSHFGGGYKNPDEAWLSVDTSQKGWEDKLFETDPRWTECYNLTRFGLDGAEIEF